MPTVTFVLNDNSKTSIDAPKGSTLMEVAIANQIKGIVADCGGLCACSTCQVLVDEAWLDVCAEPEELEKAMIDFAYNPQDNSRLACQIILDDIHDGLIVKVPARQF